MPTTPRATPLARLRRAAPFLKGAAFLWKVRELPGLRQQAAPSYRKASSAACLACSSSPVPPKLSRYTSVITAPW